MIALANKPGLETLHRRLRDLILSGELIPGSVVSQVELARDLGVSRTPLREVLRMLQQEGLVVAAPHRRVQVAHLDLQDLEYVYTHRILLECLGVSLTTQEHAPRHINEIESVLAELNGLVDSEDAEAWDGAHQRFHAALVAQTSGQLRDTVRQFQERALSYRRLYTRVLSGAVTRRPVAMMEHQRTVAAIRAHDAAAAAEELAKHLGRTALTLITELAPQHDPKTLRSGLQMVVRGDLRVTALAHLPGEPEPPATRLAAVGGE